MSRLTLILAAFAFVACGPQDAEAPPPNEPAVETPAPQPPPVSTAGNGLPCDVERVLKANCGTCHGATPANGAPNSLVTRADLVKESTYGSSLGERSVARMKDPAVPMPPSYFAPKVKAADVAVVESWVTSGMPEGVCASGP